MAGGLSIAPADGQQNVTQDPQTAPKQPVGSTTQSGKVQPGTADSLLTSSQGVGLHGQSLTTVSLVDTGTQTAASTSASSPAVPAKHHVNAAAISIPIIFCIAAVVAFWAVSRSAKSTTN
ncbi:MAG TPA: hypothetical protein VHA37_07280 [Candidatus Saccharimonadales bacterium]|nr:hypothetical protein [Candidatus Saccharimonadales bacterium]